jgi:hypothetical protein
MDSYLDADKSHRQMKKVNRVKRMFLRSRAANFGFEGADG